MAQRPGIRVVLYSTILLFRRKPVHFNGKPIKDPEQIIIKRFSTVKVLFSKINLRIQEMISMWHWETQSINFTAMESASNLLMIKTTASWLINLVTEVLILIFQQLSKILWKMESYITISKVTHLRTRSFPKRLQNRHLNKEKWHIHLQLREVFPRACVPNLDTKDTLDLVNCWTIILIKLIHGNHS